MRLRPSRKCRHWPISAWDRIFRAIRGLDLPVARVRPLFRIEVRRRRRRTRLRDGTVLRRGERIGIIHLDNAAVVRLHRSERPDAATGLEFRRLVLASLRELARQAGPGGALGGVGAVAALTIHHRALERLGFEREASAAGSTVVAAYQRALVAWLFPGARRTRAHRRHALRVWMPRERLLARYGVRPVSNRSRSITA